MKTRVLVGVLSCLLTAVVAPAWTPAGWSFWSWPYAQDGTSGYWYWFNTGDEQWVYGFPPANGWRELGQSGLAQGWSYGAWPYVYDLDGHAWYYCNESDTQWCANLWTGQWSRFGDSLPGTPGSTYLVLDLATGSTSAAYPVTELTSVPTGGWTDEYKTTKLVLRRIPAGTFMMGAPANELGRFLYEDPHLVTLTRPFYIGVYEVTQKQWERVMGTWPSAFANLAYRDTRPVETVDYDIIRGAAAGAGWPANARVDADSFLGRLRARTGRAFDLPTESQWEYAGRAGTTTALNSGHNLTNIFCDLQLDEVGRYWYNGGANALFSSAGDTNAGTAAVGSYAASPWGLYDMHGNVFEWCLDFYGVYPGAVTNPVGRATGPHRVIRGGTWGDNACKCRSAYREEYMPYYAREHIGFRLALPAGP